MRHHFFLFLVAMITTEVDGQGYAAVSSPKDVQYPPSIRCVDFSGAWRGQCNSIEFEVDIAQEGCWKMKSYHSKGLWPGEMIMSDRDFLVSYDSSGIDDLNNVRGSDSFVWQDNGGPSHLRKRMRYVLSHFFHHAKNEGVADHPFIITTANTFELNGEGNLLATTVWSSHELGGVIPKFRQFTRQCVLRRSK